MQWMRTKQCRSKGNNQSSESQNSQCPECLGRGDFKMQVINSMNSFSAGNSEVILVPNSDRYTLHSQMLLSISFSFFSLKTLKKEAKNSFPEHSSNLP